MILNFSKKAACDIYEGIFGEVDIEQVCGLVQELSNIICGIVKPRIAEFAKEIAQLVHQEYGHDDVRPEKDLPEEEIELTWDLGFPETKMGEGHALDIASNEVPKFHVPFKIKDETFHLLVLLQKF